MRPCFACLLSRGAAFVFFFLLHILSDVRWYLAIFERQFHPLFLAAEVSSGAKFTFQSDN